MRYLLLAELVVEIWPAFTLIVTSSTLSSCKVDSSTYSSAQILSLVFKGTLLCNGTAAETKPVPAASAKADRTASADDACESTHPGFESEDDASNPVVVFKWVPSMESPLEVKLAECSCCLVTLWLPTEADTSDCTAGTAGVEIWAAKMPNACKLDNTADVTVCVIVSVSEFKSTFDTVLWLSICLGTSKWVPSPPCIGWESMSTLCEIPRESVEFTLDTFGRFDFLGAWLWVAGDWRLFLFGGMTWGLQENIVGWFNASFKFLRI